MYKIARILSAVLICCFTISFFSGCGSGQDSSGGSRSENHSEERRVTSTQYLTPKASGTITYEEDGIALDVSNTSEGYLMVKYSGSSQKVKLQITVPDSTVYSYNLKIGDESSNDLDYIEQIYRYVIKNISYDDDLAANVQADYLPVIDRTLESKKGICFYYASLMAALLRSQNIPTKLVVGYSGDA